MKSIRQIVAHNEQHPDNPIAYEPSVYHTINDIIYYNSVSPESHHVSAEYCLANGLFRSSENAIGFNSVSSFDSQLSGDRFLDIVEDEARHDCVDQVIRFNRVTIATKQVKAKQFFEMGADVFEAIQYQRYSSDKLNIGRFLSLNPTMFDIEEFKTL